MSKSFIICLIFIALFPFSLLYASEGGRHSIADLIPYWINFLTFFGILYYLLRKPFLAFWRQRVELIEEAVTKGGKELIQAEKAMEEVQQLLSRVDNEASLLFDRVVEEGVNEAKAILASAKSAEVDIAENAKKIIEAERKTAEEKVLKEIAQEVVKRAEDKVKERIEDDFNRSLIDKNLDNFKVLQ